MNERMISEANYFDNPDEFHKNTKYNRARRRKRNLIAKDLRTPKYRKRIVCSDDPLSRPRITKHELLKEIENNNE